MTPGENWLHSEESEWRLLCPPYTAPDRECISKVYKNS